MLQKTYMPPQIILNDAGNTYYSTASYVIGKKFCTDKLNELIKVRNYKCNNLFFVLELTKTELIIRAAQTTLEQALYYFNQGDDKSRMIAHFEKSLIYITK